MGWIAAIVLAGTFGVLMPLIIGWFSLQEKKLKLQRELSQQSGGDLRRELDLTRAEVERLRDRVGVLERIATSEDRRVADEIDRLSRPASSASL